MRAFAVLLAGSVLICCTANATTHVVAPDGSGDYPTIQAAVDAANAGDIVELADGVFVGPGNRDVVVSISVHVLSASGNPTSCVIDCEGTVDENHRAFLVQPTADEFSLTGVRVTNAYSDGGAIDCQNPWVRISQCIINGCQSSGIRHHTPSEFDLDLSVVECTIEGNAGSGVLSWADSGDLRLRDCLLKDNLGWGAKSWLLVGDFEVVGCQIIGNAFDGLYFWTGMVGR